MNIKSSICGIQHTCINFLIFLSYRFNYKNRVLACFQTRPGFTIAFNSEVNSQTTQKFTEKFMIYYK